MNILFDARWINNNKPDGITRFSKELIKQFVMRGDDITLLVCSEDQISDFKDINKILTNRPQSSKEVTQSKRLNKYQFDLVYTPHYLFGGASREFKLIRTVHDLIPFNHKTKGSIIWRAFHFSPVFFRSIIKDSDGIVTVSKLVEKQVSKYFKGKIKVVYNAPLDRKIKNSHNDKTIVYIGRFEKYKNVECLIKAMNSLKRYNLSLIGSISDSRKSELLSLSKYRNIKFLGNVDDEVYSGMLGSSYALATASLEEGFGLPVIEAMAAGCPVICSDIDIFHEVAGQAGNYFNPEDPSDFARVVEHINNAKIRNNKVSKGLQIAKNFSWKKSYDELKLFIEDVNKK